MTLKVHVLILLVAMSAHVTLAIQAMAHIAQVRNTGKDNNNL